jgi:hypothetical protein
MGLVAIDQQAHGEVQRQVLRLRVGKADLSFLVEREEALPQLAQVGVRLSAELDRRLALCRFHSAQPASLFGFFRPAASVFFRCGAMVTACAGGGAGVVGLGTADDCAMGSRGDELPAPNWP